MLRAGGACLYDFIYMNECIYIIVCEERVVDILTY
jgi:hypothetical protein